MNRTQKTMRNGVFGLIEQILTILLSFASRKIFIQYIGVEMLGLNSTFATIFSTFSLAEMGIQRVIVYHLYGAMAKGDRKHINALVNIYKLIFHCLGIFFIAASLCCMPFLQFFLTDVEATITVRLYFLAQAVIAASSYFFAYKRNILYADQNSYISTLIDTVVNTVASLLCMAVAVLTGSYWLYLLVSMVKTYLANILVHIECTKRYPYLHSEKIDRGLLKKIASSLRDVVVEKIAGYIYSSTDNLLISAFISTVQVGFLNNYTVIISHIKTLMKSVTNPLIPAIGNMVAIGKESERQMRTFHVVVQGCFWLTGLSVVPVYVLAEDFICIYLGEKFVLPRVLLLLMCVDMYAIINQDSCLSFLTANGLFRKRRNISIGGAIVNIVVSVLLIKPMGIAGILAGTAVSQVYYWVARSVVTLRDCLNQSWRACLAYWLKQLGLLGIIVAATWLSSTLIRNLFVLNSVLTFVIDGIICEACFILLALCCCHALESQRRLEGIVISLLLKLLKKGRIRK